MPPGCGALRGLRCRGTLAIRGLDTSGSVQWVEREMETGLNRRSENGGS